MCYQYNIKQKKMEINIPNQILQTTIKRIEWQYKSVKRLHHFTHKNISYNNLVQSYMYTI